jgi:hypothetical protein
VLPPCVQSRICHRLRSPLQLLLLLRCCPPTTHSQADALVALPYHLPSPVPLPPSPDLLIPPVMPITAPPDPPPPLTQCWHHRPLHCHNVVPPTISHRPPLHNRCPAGPQHGSRPHPTHRKEDLSSSLCSLSEVIYGLTIFPCRPFDVSGWTTCA